MVAEALERATRGRVTLLRLALLATAAIYAQSLSFHFVFDDLPQIVLNQRIRDWSSLPQFFTASTWGVSETILQYRPLFLLWLRLNHSLFETSPMGWHATTLAAHLAVVWLVYRLMNQITPDRDVAGFTTLLFALHPAHMETAVWVSAVSETLYVMPALGGVILYIRAQQEQRPVLIWASAALFGIALFFKETAVSLAGVLIGYEWLFRQKPPDSPRANFRVYFQRALPFALVGAIYFGARAFALRTFTHFPYEHSRAEVFLTWPSAFWFYVKRLIWPFGPTSQFYDVGFAAGTSRDLWTPLLGIAAVLGLALWWARRDQLAAFALLWLLPLLPPLVGIYSFGDHDVVHDRYLYLPVLAVAICLAAGSGQWSRYAALSRLSHVRFAPVIVLTMMLGLYAFHVVRDQRIYRNDVALYERAVEVAPGKAALWNFLGYAYAQDGKPAPAISAHRRALELRPLQWQAHDYLGDIYFAQGDFRRASEHFRAASARMQGADAALRWHKLGLALVRLGDDAQAEAAFRRALALAPPRLGYHYSLGQALRRQGRLAEAAVELQREIDLYDSPQAKAALAEIRAAN